MEDLLKLAKKEKLTELESAWLSAVAEGEFTLQQMLPVPEVLAERGHSDTAESLLWFLTDALLEAGRREDAFEAAHSGALLLPESSVMREFVTDLYVEQHRDRPDTEALVRATVGRADTPLDEAVECLDRLMRLEPGTYVLDPRRGEAGRVVEFDPEEGALLVEFAEEERSYGPAFVTRLEPLEPDDFRALSTFERERLVELAEDDPEELVRVVLSSLDRRMPARRLRLYLEPIVGSWRRWWSGAEGTIRRSSIIGMTEGTAPSLFLRREPLSHGERLLRRLEAEREPLPALTLSLDALRQAAEHMEEGRQVAERVAQRAAAMADDAAERGKEALLVAAHAVLDVARRQFAGLEAPELPPLPGLAPEQGAELARALAEPRVLTCALEALRRREVDGWPELFTAALPHSPRPVCRMIAERLAAAGETSALAAGAAQIVSRPDAAGSAVAWLWRQCRAGQPTPGLQEVDPLAALFKLLSTAASLVRDRGITSDERKEQVAELRSAVFVRDGGTLREVVSEAPPEQLASLAGMVERNPALTGQMRARIVHVLQEAEPSLFARHVPAWQEDCIYTTEEGLERRRAELRRVVDVRLPQVVREIGEAASFGDVSDNAEYQSAIRERSRLADLAERMRQEIARARPITRQMAETEHVTVGSRVKVRNLKSGQEQELRFLGPWDADPDAGIYAYNASLGEQFMGRRPGEEVTFQAGPTERRWEILEVAPAL